jgi:hypothetical protein
MGQEGALRFQTAPQWKAENNWHRSLFRGASML